MRTKVLVSVLVLFSLLASCNLPVGQVPVTQPPEGEPVSSGVDAVGTAVALTSAAQLTQTAAAVTPTFTAQPTITFTPTQCSPLVTATVNANVRSGPDTAYGIVGLLSLGQTATIVGRNDAYTWWYIAYPGAAGGHAWIAGSVVTSACVPSVVQVVAAPPLPTAPPVADTSDDEDDDSGPSPKPDLAISGMSVTPNPATQNHPINVQVTIINHGNAPAEHFSVQWWSSWAVVACNWSVASLGPSQTKVLTCSYTYQGWNNAYAIKAVVDSGNLVDESKEGNNSREATLPVQKD